MTETKPKFFVRRSCLCLNTFRRSKTTLKLGPLNKITANEYLQAYNTGVGVKSHGVCSLHQCKCAGNTMILKKFSLSN